MTELSPAAQAIRSAYHEICEDYIETWLSFNHNRGLAAALRAVAMEVVLNKYQYADWQMADMIMKEIQAIADELEAHMIVV